MSPPRAEIEVLLRFGPHMRRVPLAALAAITHESIAAIRDALSRLLFALIDPSAEWCSDAMPGNLTEGERSNVGPALNVQENEERNVDGNVGTHAGARPTPPRALTAERLASELHDDRSLRYFRQLLAAEPIDLVSAALAETVARRAEIRGRPGAYFTGVLRALKRARILHLHPHARTSSTPP